VTDVTTDGEETEKATKTGRKRYMLSGAVDVASGAATAVVRCRLFQRGDGWETRQERSLCAAAAGDASGAPGRLLERNVLVRPGKEDVVVNRYFTKVA
jgi:hypothetical protein